MAGGGWSSLPADLLREISGRLSSDADHLHIHQVCAHWRSFTSLPAAFRPWVLVGRARRSRLLPIVGYSLWLPHAARRMDVGAPAGLPYCCGASWGWLALVDDGEYPTRLVLWEPVSRTEIPLPCLSPITRVSLSDDPLASSDWVAVASQIIDREGQKTLSCRPGDAAWTTLFERGTSEIDTVAFHGGKVYYIDNYRNIFICDPSNMGDGAGPPPPKCRMICYVYTAVNKLCRCERFHVVRGVHLVACKGDLLLVVLRWEDHPSLAEVYKPEWTPNNRVVLRERVMDLGDHSLFVVRGHAFALSAKEFPAIKRNCVYYLDKPFKQQHWMSVFHLESDVLEEIPYPEELKEKEDAPGWKQYAWFCLRKPFLKQQ